VSLRRRYAAGRSWPRPVCAVLLVGSLLAVPLDAAGAQPARRGDRPELVVAAAADLAFALREMQATFEREQPAKVTLVIGSTGQLAQQIEHGAPYDVFLAADASFVEALRAKGAVLPDTVQTYAYGRLVLATKRGSSPLADLAELLRPEVKRVALANPVHAPYGRAARQALERAGIWTAVQPRLVYGENIQQALQFLQTGNVEAALLARSLADVPELQFTPIDPALYDPLRQVAAVTTGSRHPDLARAFIRFVCGPESRPILKGFGFLLPGEL
jgi:molybdate transport system substrate-binding protein